MSNDGSVKRAGWFQSSVVSPVHVLSKAGGAVSAVGILFLALATTFDVLMRYVFNSPTKWVLESSEWVLLFVVMGCVAYTQREKGHIRVDIIMARFSPAAQRKFEVFSSLLGVLYCGFLSWAGFVATMSLYDRGTVSIVLGIPLYLVVVWVGIGAAMLALEHAITLISSARKA